MLNIIFGFNQKILYKMFLPKVLFQRKVDRPKWAPLPHHSAFTCLCCEGIQDGGKRIEIREAGQTQQNPNTQTPSPFLFLCACFLLVPNPGGSSFRGSCSSCCSRTFLLKSLSAGFSRSYYCPCILLL